MDLLGRLDLAEHIDEFRAALISMGATETPSDAQQAIALIATLMGKAKLSRGAIQRVIADLSDLSDDDLMADTCAVTVFDGTYMFVPKNPDGRFFRLHDMQVVPYEMLTQPLMVVAFLPGKAFKIVKEP